MTLNINSELEDVPGELKRSVEEFWPDAVVAEVAGQKLPKVVMALGTKELRRSLYDNAQVDLQWLYFQPEGARGFARLLNQLADEAERMQK